MTTTLELPKFYNPANAGDINYAPDEWAVVEAATEYRDRHGLKAAATDNFKLFALGIDLQGDFCFPEGSLFVGGRGGNGAVEDNARICDWMYRNLDIITAMMLTVDTHFMYQIFFPTFWLNEAGTMPGPHTIITADEIRTGKYVPNPVAATVCGVPYTWLQKQVLYYCEQLESAGKYMLYLWPLHCLFGGRGHNLAGVIQEARLFHGAVRGMQNELEVKGGNPLTENYSVFSPEVLGRHDKGSLAQRNVNALKTLTEADAVVVFGQAASHCVKSSIDDLLDEILHQDADLARKVYVMTDCMSSVVVPGGGPELDYTDKAEAAFKRFADNGMNLVKSTDDPRDWPGIKL